MLSLIPVGLYMVSMPYSPEKLEIYALHKSFGLLILGLVFFRFFWRFLNVSPAHLQTHQRWEKTLAGGAHIFFYLAMMIMPSTGWLMSSAGDYPVPFFGIEMPDLIAKDQELFQLFKQAHEYIAYLIIAVIGLHAAGALKHHILDRDETLERMMVSGKRLLTGFLALLLIGSFFGSVAYFVLPEFLESNRPVVEESSIQNNIQSSVEEISEEILRSTGIPPQKQATAWNILSEKSRIVFLVDLYGSAMEGVFPDFNGEIFFDPDDLTSSSAKIEIKILSAKTGDDSRDSELQKPVFFNTAEFPKAIFEARTFEHLGGNEYQAFGDLSIKGVSKNILLPFTLAIDEKADPKTAKMNASLSLNRLDFSIGEGEWESGDTLGHEVDIQITLEAEESIAF